MLSLQIDDDWVLYLFGGILILFFHQLVNWSVHLSLKSYSVSLGLELFLLLLKIYLLFFLLLLVKLFEIWCLVLRAQQAISATLNSIRTHMVASKAEVLIFICNKFQTLGNSWILLNQLRLWKLYILLTSPSSLFQHLNHELLILELLPRTRLLFILSLCIGQQLIIRIRLIQFQLNALQGTWNLYFLENFVSLHVPCTLGSFVFKVCTLRIVNFIHHVPFSYDSDLFGSLLFANDHLLVSGFS